MEQTIRCTSCKREMDVNDVWDHPKHSVKDIRYKCPWCKITCLAEYESYIENDEFKWRLIKIFW
jgi:hypothetical protein